MAINFAWFGQNARCSAVVPGRGCYGAHATSSAHSLSGGTNVLTVGKTKMLRRIEMPSSCHSFNSRYPGRASVVLSGMEVWGAWRPRQNDVCASVRLVVTMRASRRARSRQPLWH